MIKVGDTIPHTTLMEFSEVEGEGCSIGPNAVDVAKATAGKTIAVFALPGAFTPTCSALALTVSGSSPTLPAVPLTTPVMTPTVPGLTL